MLLFLSFITSIEQTITINGQVVPMNNIATIKHETGGEVLKVYVDNYSHVNKGDLLLTLDNNKILTSLKQNKSKLKVVDTEILYAAAYLKKNLKSIARQDVYKEVEQYLNNISDTIVHSKQLVQASRLVTDYKDEVIQEQINKNKIEIAQIDDDLNSLDKKLNQLAEQRDIFSTLLKSKNVSKVRAIDYEVKYIDVTRDIKAAKSKRDMLIRENNELESKRVINEQDAVKEKYEELVDFNKEKIDLVSNISQLETMLSQLTIKAPISGTIQGLNVVKGINIQPGEEVFSIIPDDTKVLFEAQASLQQKGKVNITSDSEVQFDGFNVLEYNRVPAKIVNVSPYTFVDEVNRNKYVKILLQLDSDKVVSKQDEFRIKPGMSGIVYINSGKRSLFGYLFGPIYNSFYNAYNEK